MQPTFLHLHGHLGTRQIVTPPHSETKPLKGVFHVLRIYFCAHAMSHSRLGEEIFIVDYKGHSSSGMAHVVGTVFSRLGSWTDATSEKWSYFGYQNPVFYKI